MPEGSLLADFRNIFRVYAWNRKRAGGTVGLTGNVRYPIWMDADEARELAAVLVEAATVADELAPTRGRVSRNEAGTEGETG